MPKTRTSVMIPDYLFDKMVREKANSNKCFGDIIADALAEHYKNECPMSLAKDVFNRVGYDAFIELLDRGIESSDSTTVYVK